MHKTWYVPTSPISSSLLACALNVNADAPRIFHFRRRLRLRFARRCGDPVGQLDGWTVGRLQRQLAHTSGLENGRERWTYHQPSETHGQRAQDSTYAPYLPYPIPHIRHPAPNTPYPPYPPMHAAQHTRLARMLGTRSSNSEDSPSNSNSPSNSTSPSDSDGGRWRLDGVSVANGWIGG